MKRLSRAHEGVLLGAFAYGSWGILPIYFRALEPAGPLEILALRILWSAICCAAYLALRGNTAWIRALWQHPRQVAVITLAAYLLSLNWGVYIYAVNSGNVVQSSLGYFINPILLVLTGVIVLKEQMTAMQWLAISLGALAVVVITIDYGQPPWIALTLAISFTIYGYIKKMIGINIGATETMTVESIVLTPFAMVLMGWLAARGPDLTYMSEGGVHAVLLSLLGVATILPLIAFGAAAHRLPLVAMGMLQFISPIGQFTIGVVVFHEQMSRGRWLGFGIVWIALILLTIDSTRSYLRRRALRPA